MQATLDRIDAGPADTVLQIGPDLAISTVLAEFVLPTPAGVVEVDALAFDTIPALNDPSANNGGTASHARIVNGDGIAVVSGLTVTLTGEGGDITLSNLIITQGQPINITGGRFIHA